MSLTVYPRKVGSEECQSQLCDCFSERNFYVHNQRHLIASVQVAHFFEGNKRSCFPSSSGLSVMSLVVGMQNTRVEHQEAPRLLSMLILLWSDTNFVLDVLYITRSSTTFLLPCNERMTEFAQPRNFL